LKIAVPAFVNWAVPRMWMSVQYVAEASQKLTCPVFTLVEPAITVAVSVTTVPEATVVTEPPPELMARVVVVAPLPAQACDAPASKNIKNAKKTDSRKKTLNFIGTVVPQLAIERYPGGLSGEGEVYNVPGEF
jgi:hypothetical protein